VNYNGNLQVSEVTNKVDALSSTQFKDFVTANGTAAQIALLGTADTIGKMKFTELLLVRS
jgi:iron complex outermembrane receptor protein